MPSLFDKQIDVYENNIQLSLDKSFNKLVNSKMRTLQKQLELLQDDFFTMLATMISGADGPPNLGPYTPSWKPLSDTYAENREYSQDVPEGEFFRFSGQMETTLAKLNPRTFLGKPVVTYKRGRYQQRVQQNYKAPNRKNFSEPMRALIEVDLFPKIVGSINEVTEANLFDHVKLSWITETRGNKTTKTPISYRFRNFQGNRDRPVVVEYLNWWLNVKAKRLIKGFAK